MRYVRQAAAFTVMLAGTACSKPVDVLANEAAAETEQNLTMKNAVGDVDAAMAAARPSLTGAAIMDSESNKINTSVMNKDIPSRVR